MAQNPSPGSSQFSKRNTSVKIKGQCNKNDAELRYSQSTSKTEKWQILPRELKQGTREKRKDLKERDVCIIKQNLNST